MTQSMSGRRELGCLSHPDRVRVPVESLVLVVGDAEAFGGLRGLAGAGSVGRLPGLPIAEVRSEVVDCCRVWVDHHRAARVCCGTFPMQWLTRKQVCLWVDYHHGAGANSKVGVGGGP